MGLAAPVLMGDDLLHETQLSGESPLQILPVLHGGMQSAAARSHKEIIQHVVVVMKCVIYNPAKIITTLLFNEC